MAKNSFGKMNMADQKDGNTQTYPKKGPTGGTSAMPKGKPPKMGASMGMSPPPFSIGGGVNKGGKGRGK